MTRLFLILALVFLTACSSQPPTIAPSSSDLKLKDPLCQNGGLGDAGRLMISTFQSALSHPDDPSAIQKDMERVQALLAEKENNPYKNLLAAKGNQELALMRQLQKDGQVAKTEEFEQAGNTLVESLQTIYEDWVTRCVDE